MEHDAIQHFENKKIKLTYNNGFNLKGTVLEVYKDSIFFRTSQCDSVIPLTEIKSVVGVSY